MRNNVREPAFARAGFFYRFISKILKYYLNNEIKLIKRYVKFNLNKRNIQKVLDRRNNERYYVVIYHFISVSPTQFLDNKQIV